jgi:microcompartment protein CcmK/EutM
VIAGRVIGEVWATKKAPGLRGRRLLLVAVDGEDRVMIAIDTLDAREGQAVLVAPGSGGRNVIQPGPDNRAVLCDAAIALLRDDLPELPTATTTTAATTTTTTTEKR